ncbi:RNA polymerase sigma factor [Dyadobacter luticola]|uniref:RNA polymerase subunit sigma-24 n=1 Tax=Dyadobacter luticola TaxID=1979387 RepID=A0A5R9KVM3_9BACT|nr:RNA polymerase subunit sigma-24 [Dyadobacter luticola]TLV00117.1 RNA polymerase subunit sigma-24 [Dyadobacter luticola]
MTYPYQQILYQVTQGDEAAFNQLYSHFHVTAFKFCSIILKDETEAENITKEVFAKIWNDRVQLNPEGSFQSYLFLNLKNEIFCQMKKYADPAARGQYLDKINSFQGN